MFPRVTRWAELLLCNFCNEPMKNSDRNTVSSVPSPEGASIVVPCCNEEAGLCLLDRRLSNLRALLAPKYEMEFILVDDGSTDRTWTLMNEIFRKQRDVTLLQHGTNRGIGAAILTGIRAAQTEIVCSIDSDCSYDPCELARMIPMLAAGVDLVTASPYHPQGQVLNVPWWRLILSKTASRLYQQVLQQHLHTYTSCFRVYRRSAILKLVLKREGFLAVSELVAKLDQQGSVVLECPVTLAARVHGVSKMKTVRVIFGHLQLLCELLISKMWRAMHRCDARVASTSLISSQG